MDATQELDKRINPKTKALPPDPTLELVKNWWGFWLPGLINHKATHPGGVFSFTNPFWWWGWKK